jgi:hypothetical protein
VCGVSGGVSGGAKHDALNMRVLSPTASTLVAAVQRFSTNGQFSQSAVPELESQRRFRRLEQLRGQDLDYLLLDQSRRG